MLAMPTDFPTATCRALPKGHLHVHLEGAMRPTTLAELAGDRRDPGARDPRLRLVHARSPTPTSPRARCSLTPDDFARLVYEVVEDSVLDGAVWVEPSFYAPHHRNRFGDRRGRSSTWCSTRCTPPASSSAWASA